MTIEKAKNFLKFVGDNEEVKAKMAGFSMEELQQAAIEIKGNNPLSDDDLDSIAGGGCIIAG